MATRVTRELVGNALLAGFLVLLGLASLPYLTVWGTQTRPADLTAAGLVVVAAVAAGLRWWPLASFGITTVVTAAYLVAGYPYGPILVCLAVASYTLSRRMRLPVALLAAAVALPVLLAHVFADDDTLGGVWELLPGAAWIVVPFSVGLARRITVDAAARQRAEAERRALDEERLRLASEVHDVVGHGLAAIQMQADIARHLRQRRPEQADIALDAISRTSAEALAELRATLAEIAPARARDRRESLAPTPGLHRLADLCHRMRESGVEVDLTVTGRRPAVAPATDVAAYRIVQESLTNVARHATRRRADVHVRYAPTAVEIEVGSATHHREPPPEGFGIAGMRRRVSDVGGSLTVGPDGGRFLVAATLPLDP